MKVSQSIYYGWWHQGGGYKGLISMDFEEVQRLYLLLQKGKADYDGADLIKIRYLIAIHFMDQETREFTENRGLDSRSLDLIHRTGFDLKLDGNWNFCPYDAPHLTAKQVVEAFQYKEDYTDSMKLVPLD